MGKHICIIPFTEIPALEPFTKCLIAQGGHLEDLIEGGIMTLENIFFHLKIVKI